MDTNTSQSTSTNDNDALDQLINGVIDDKNNLDTDITNLTTAIDADTKTIAGNDINQKKLDTTTSGLTDQETKLASQKADLDVQISKTSDNINSDDKLLEKLATQGKSNQTQISQDKATLADLDKQIKALTAKKSALIGQNSDAKTKLENDQAQNKGEISTLKQTQATLASGNQAYSKEKQQLDAIIAHDPLQDEAIQAKPEDRLAQALAHIQQKDKNAIAQLNEQTQKIKQLDENLAPFSKAKNAPQDFERFFYANNLTATPQDTGNDETAKSERLTELSTERDSLKTKDGALSDKEKQLAEQIAKQNTASDASHTAIKTKQENIDQLNKYLAQKKQTLADEKKTEAAKQSDLTTRTPTDEADQKTLSSLGDQIKDAQAKRDQLNSSVTVLSNDLAKTQKEDTALVQATQDSTSQEEKLHAQIKQLQSDNTRLTSQLQQAEQTLQGENYQLNNVLHPAPSLALTQQDAPGGDEQASAINQWDTLQAEMKDKISDNRSLIEQKQNAVARNEEGQLHDQRTALDEESKTIEDQLSTFQSYSQDPQGHIKGTSQDHINQAIALTHDVQKDVDAAQSWKESHPDSTQAPSEEQTPAKSTTLDVTSSREAFNKTHNEIADNQSHFSQNQADFKQPGAPSYKDVQWHHRGKSDPNLESKEATDKTTTPTTKEPTTTQQEIQQTSQLLDNFASDEKQLAQASQYLPHYSQKDLAQERTSVNQQYQTLQKEEGEHSFTAGDKTHIDDIGRNLTSTDEPTDQNGRDRAYNDLLGESSSLSTIKSQEEQSHAHDQKDSLCFCAYTKIRTPDRDRDVQDLKVGDLVVTSSGKVKPITWIGSKEMSFEDNTIDERNSPICIKRNALGRNIPYRDLYLSPAHALAFDIEVRDFFFKKRTKRILVRASSLINHTTITQIPMRKVHYWHVELAEHDLLVANGVRAESFLDNGEKMNFSSQTRNNVLPLFGKKQALAPRVKRGRHLRNIRSSLAQYEERRNNEEKRYFHVRCA